MKPIVIIAIVVLFYISAGVIFANMAQYDDICNSGVTRWNLACTGHTQPKLVAFDESNSVIWQVFNGNPGALILGVTAPPLMSGTNATVTLPQCNALTQVLNFIRTHLIFKNSVCIPTSNLITLAWNTLLSMLGGMFLILLFAFLRDFSITILGQSVSVGVTEQASRLMLSLGLGILLYDVMHDFEGSWLLVLDSIVPGSFAIISLIIIGLLSFGVLTYATSFTTGG